MKGIIITNSEAAAAVYGAAELREIERRVQVIALPQTADSLGEAPERLRDAEVIFSGPGLMRLDEWFLRAAPNLKIIFFAGETPAMASLVTPALWRRGIQVAAVPIDAVQAGNGEALLPPGARVIAELDRFLAGEPMRWRIPPPAGVASAPPAALKSVSAPTPAPAFAPASAPVSSPAPASAGPPLIKMPARPMPAALSAARAVSAPLAAQPDAASGSVPTASGALLSASGRLAPAAPLPRPPGSAELEEAPFAPKRRITGKWLFSRVFLGSVALHLVFLIIAAYYVVSVYRAGKPTFKSSGKAEAASKNSLEHRIQSQKRAKAAAGAPPPSVRRVVSVGASKIVLPSMPAMPAAPVTAQISAISGMGAGGFGTGFGRGSGSGGTGGPGGMGGGGGVNFFGLRDAGAAIVIMIDVSDSMFTRTGDAEGRALVKQGKEQNFQVVRDEAVKLVNSLTPGTRFGIVRWSGGAYSWKPELVPATEENKAAAVEHIENEVNMKTARPKGGRPGGTRHDYALEEAFALKPEVIYMITDGNATAAIQGGGLEPIPADEIWKAAETGEKTLTKRAKINVVYYLTGADKPEEENMLRQLSGRNGGKFVKVEAKGRRR